MTFVKYPMQADKEIVYIISRGLFSGKTSVFRKYSNTKTAGTTNLKKILNALVRVFISIGTDLVDQSQGNVFEVKISMNLFGLINDVFHLFCSEKALSFKHSLNLQNFYLALKYGYVLNQCLDRF